MENYSTAESGKSEAEMLPEKKTFLSFITYTCEGYALYTQLFPSFIMTRSASKGILSTAFLI